MVAPTESWRKSGGATKRIRSTQANSESDWQETCPSLLKNRFQTVPKLTVAWTAASEVRCRVRTAKRRLAEAGIRILAQQSMTIKNSEAVVSRTQLESGTMAISDVDRWISIHARVPRWPHLCPSPSIHHKILVLRILFVKSIYSAILVTKVFAFWFFIVWPNSWSNSLDSHVKLSSDHNQIIKFNVDVSNFENICYLYETESY